MSRSHLQRWRPKWFANITKWIFPAKSRHSIVQWWFMIEKVPFLKPKTSFGQPGEVVEWNDGYFHKSRWRISHTFNILNRKKVLCANECKFCQIVSHNLGRALGPFGGRIGYFRLNKTPSLQLCSVRTPFHISPWRPRWEGHCVVTHQWFCLLRCKAPVWIFIITRHLQEPMNGKYDGTLPMSHARRWHAERWCSIR